MSRGPAENLTSSEVTELCTVAQAAWDRLGPRGSQAKFTWRGKFYVATHSIFRLCVDTPDGRPVACRYL
jgi:hypothetical protein